MAIFNNNRIHFSQLYDDAYAFLTQKYNQARKVFTVSSAYGQILYVILKLQEMIFFYIEDSVTEANINSASRAESVRGLARLAGHNAVRSIAASGELIFNWNGNNPGIHSEAILIPNFTKLLCLNNGLPYVLDLPQEEIRVKMQAAKPTIKARIIQGEIQTQTFTGTGLALQSFEVVTRGGRLIDQFFYNIFVNGTRWKTYDSLYDMPKDKEGVMVKTGIGSGIDIIFGNGYFGKMPSTGAEIRVEYLLTDGEAGNLRESSEVSFEFQEPGYDLFGGELELNSLLDIRVSQPVEFGTNAESLQMTRLLAPKVSRSFVLANPENYVYFLEKYNYFSQIHAYSTFEDEYLDDDNVIYLFLVPDIQKRIFNTENYFTVPIEFFQLSKVEKQKVYDLVDRSGSKIVTTELKIVDPIIRKYVVNISLITFEGYSIELIQQQIVQKFSDFFLTLRRRDRIPKSDLIHIIEEIEGVDSVSIFFVCEENEKLKAINPDAEEIGMDDYGDILIGRDEIPLIRGGWQDRNGIEYEDTISMEKPSSVNIEIRKVVKEDYNSKMNRLNKQSIK